MTFMSLGKSLRPGSQKRGDISYSGGEDRDSDGIGK